MSKCTTTLYSCSITASYIRNATRHPASLLWKVYVVRGGLGIMLSSLMHGFSSCTCLQTHGSIIVLGSALLLFITAHMGSDAACIRIGVKAALSILMLILAFLQAQSEGKGSKRVERDRGAHTVQAPHAITVCSNVVNMASRKCTRPVKCRPSMPSSARVLNVVRSTVNWQASIGIFTLAHSPRPAANQRAASSHALASPWSLPMLQQHLD